MAHDNFPHLFSPFQINKLKLKNRIISTGHETHLNDGGLIGDRMVAYHEARAKGGAGLIMTEVALVHPGAVFVADPIRVDTDEFVKTLPMSAADYELELDLGMNDGGSDEETVNND